MGPIPACALQGVSSVSCASSIATTAVIWFFLTACNACIAAIRWRLCLTSSPWPRWRLRRRTEPGCGVVWVSAVAVLPQASSIACAPTARPTGPATLQCLRMTIRRCACPAARPGCCRICPSPPTWGAGNRWSLPSGSCSTPWPGWGWSPCRAEPVRCLSSWPTGRVVRRC